MYTLPCNFIRKGENTKHIKVTIWEGKLRLLTEYHHDLFIIYLSLPQQFNWI